MYYTTSSLLGMNSVFSSTAVSSAASSIVCFPLSSSRTTASSNVSPSTALSPTQLVQQFKSPKSLRFPKRRKVRSNHFVLHGVKNMIGSTTMSVLMLYFVTCVCKLNMKRILASKSLHHKWFYLLERSYNCIQPTSVKCNSFGSY